MQSQHFPPTASQAVREQVGKDHKNTRLFIGTGDAVLPIPGYQEGTLKRVVCGITEIPLEIEEQHPTDSTHTRFETVKVPLLLATRDEDGQPILRRGVKSNDGIWQKGEKIYVTALWEPEGAKK